MKTTLNASDSHELYNEASEFLKEQNVYNTVTALKANTVIEGNQWMTLKGDNIQIGICGFGDTPYLSMFDFCNQLHTKI